MSQIMVASYNIQNGINEQAILKNLQTLVTKGVDLVCLQEARDLPKRQSLTDRIRKALGKEWECHFWQDQNDPVSSLGLGMCWSTQRLKLIKVRDILLPKAKYSLWARLLAPGMKIAQRGAIAATFRLDDQIFRMTNLHLDWQGTVKDRWRQIQWLQQDLERIDMPEIMGGDFNTIENKRGLSNTYTKLHKVVGLDFTETFKEGSYTTIHGLTADLHYPLLYIVQKILILTKLKIYHRLDYIWYKKMKLISSQILNLPGSDHLPLIAKFEQLL